MAAVLIPPFTEESALAKVQMAEDLWNTRDPERVVLAYTEDSEWRNRTEFLKGRQRVRAFLREEVGEGAGLPNSRRRCGEFRGNRMAVSFEYEWHDDGGQWYRSYGVELWSSAKQGLCSAKDRDGINDAPIEGGERRVGN